jgi:hypothetical protein
MAQSMAQRVEDLLQECTLQVCSRGIARGTGFFVAPGLALTCAHVIGEEVHEPLQIRWQGQIWAARLQERYGGPPGPDLALLAVDCPDHPCVLLCGTARPHSKLYSYGYPRQAPEGSGFAYSTGGPAGPQSERLTFQQGPVDLGMSGSPLLDLESGSVCGIIQFSLGIDADRGGQALQTHAILATFPRLAETQLRFHQTNRRWLAALAEGQRSQLRRLCPQYALLLASTDSPGAPLKVFLSCADHRTDRRLLKELEKHLSGLKREGLITAWYADKLSAGSPKEQAKAALEEADLILPLISTDYMDSDYHYDEELQRALQRHQAGTARVIPIRLRSAESFAHSPLGALVPLPRNGPPINEYRNRDKIWTEVACEIRTVVQELRGGDRGPRTGGSR